MSPTTPPKKPTHRQRSSPDLILGVHRPTSSAITKGTTDGKRKGQTSATASHITTPTQTLNELVCCPRSFMPNWFILDGFKGRLSSEPFIAHAQIMMPTFNHILQVIRGCTSRFHVEGNEWVPRQILGSTSSSHEWRLNLEGTGSRPDSIDIVSLRDDEDVTVWMTAAASHSILSLFVVFHQVDQRGNQTPAPDFQPYLAPEIYCNMDEEEERIRLGNDNRPGTIMRVPALATARPAPATARPAPAAGESVLMGPSRERAQQSSVKSSPIARLVARTHGV